MPDTPGTPGAPWRESYTLIASATTAPGAVTEAHAKLQALYDDWRARIGAQALAIIGTQLWAEDMVRPDAGHGPAYTERVYLFLITYQIDGITPAAGRASRAPRS